MKKFLNYICLILVFAMMCPMCVSYAGSGVNSGSGGGGGGSFAGSTANVGSIIVSADFNQNSYLPGDTAEASLYITETRFASMEEDDKYSVGSFEVNIEYDPSILVPYRNNAEVTDKGVSAGEINTLLGLTADDKYEIVTAEKHPEYLENDKELIVCYFESSNGVTYDADGRILVGKCLFKVKAQSGEVGVSLRNANLYKPYKGSGDEVDKAKLTIKTLRGDTVVVAKETDIICDVGEYSSTTGEIQATPTVRTTKNAFLVAQLYDTQNNITRDIKTFSIVYDSDKAEYTQPLTFNNVKGSDNLVIRYYLWGATSSGLGMTPLTESKTANVDDI